MQETSADLETLQYLLDSSYERAGTHAREVITAEHRVDAVSLAERLVGMCLLVVATTTADGRPVTGPVDGYFFRGQFYFGSSADSVKMRHLAIRPHVSATYLPGEDLAVSVHGTVELIDVKQPEHAAFRRMLLDRNVPLYGAEWEEMIDSTGVYARIHADRMLTFAMDPPAETE